MTAGPELPSAPEEPGASCAGSGPDELPLVLDEVFVSIGGRRMYLWRAVDDEGEV